MSQMNNKEELRKEMRRRRNDLTLTQIHDLTRKCFDNLAALPEFQANQWIYSYMAIGSEVDTIDLICDFIRMGKKVAVPKVEDDEIAFYEIQSIKDCRPGEFGILERLLTRRRQTTRG